MSNDAQSNETSQSAAGFSPHARWGKRLLIGTGVVGLAVLGVAVVRWVPISHHFYTDADTIKVPATLAPTRDILWQPPRKLADVINTAADDYEPRLSADGLTLFFVRGKAGENADIFWSRRTYDGWTDAEALAGINSEYEELGPEPSADGQSLYFYSDRPGGFGGYDVWVAHLGDNGWQTPINLGPLVNSEFNDYGPALTPDGGTLYFASNRPQASDREEPDPNAWPATLREDLYQRNYDLYMAPVTDRGAGRAEPLALLNTPYNDGAPAVSSFGDFLYFASDRPGGEGAFDLYRSRRLRGEHQPAENLGSTVNTAANELDPGLSLGGYALYFSSDRPSDQAGFDTPRKYDLYHTTSREVFAEAERVERPPIDWAALWSQIGPNLLWALLALLLLLAFLALLRDARGRRLSLLAKCLLASLVAHMLLMLLFNVWEVTATLAEQFRRRGAIRIALASPVAGDSLADQITGRLTSAETAAIPLTIEHERRAARAEVPPPVAEAMAALTVERGVIRDSSTSTLDLTVQDASIEHRPRPPELSEPLLSPRVPLAFEPDMPTEQSRITSDEPHASSAADTMTAESVTRPPVTPAEHQPSNATYEAASMPPTPVRLESPSDRVSMASPSTTSDARPSPSNSNDVASVNLSTPALDLPQMSDLTLPTARVERLPETVEGVPKVTVPATAELRGELSGAVLPAPTIQGPSRIMPETTSPPQSYATFVDSPSARASDASVATQSSDSQQTLRLDLPMVPLNDVSLSSLDTATAVAAAESTAVTVVDVTTPVRRELSVDREPRATPDTFAAIEPVTGAVTPVSASFAASPGDRASDATLAQARFDPVPEHGAAVAVPPTLMDLTLPVTAESAVASEPECSLRPDVVESHLPRASLAPKVEDTGSPAAAVFDVSPSWQLGVRDAPDESARMFAENVVSDGHVEQLAWAPADSTLSPHDLTIPDTPALHLDLPAEELAPTNPYAQRRVPDRLALVERMGGSEETERAVADALRWLANHQSPDGRWDGDGFDEGCGQCGGETEVAVDHALTGLAMLCFLGAGHTHVSDGPYRDTVERALDWLVSRQGRDGDLRGDETMYSHGIATIAISEAYGMTGDADLVEPIRRATRFIDGARNESVGGWRYDPGQVGDTSVLGWQVMALKSASVNGVAVPAESFPAARKWLDLVSTPSHPGLYAYQPGRRPTPPMTAEGMFSQQLLGRGSHEPRMQASAEYVLQFLPEWESGPNTYYWYYATLALFQHQGEAWRTWNEGLTEQLLTHQRRDEPTAGSWDPVGEWASIGGRVYQTALCTLMLEVYYRYLPLYSLDSVTDPIGAIRGSVIDVSTGKPLGGAAVRLDLPDDSPVSVATTPDGTYVLSTPEVPDFFALSASKEGYVPSTANVASAMVQGTTLTLDFELRPESGDLVALEPVPDVHHLGDNKFDGTINSKFQKESEGSSYAAEFELGPHQVAPHVSKGEVHLLAKGVQRRHTIKINGVVLDDRLEDAPEDGSFGEFSAPFDVSLLHTGTNTFEIIARPSTSDIDDFEFVNVRIVLSP